METKDNDDDDKVWLTYWVVYGLFSIVDEFSGFILNIIPFYYFAKVCFLIWLYNPATQGAKVIYKTFCKPLLKKYEKQINEGLKLVKEAVTDIKGLSPMKSSEGQETQTGATRLTPRGV